MENFLSPIYSIQKTKPFEDKNFQLLVEHLDHCDLITDTTNCHTSN